MQTIEMVASALPPARNAPVNIGDRLLAGACLVTMLGALYAAFIYAPREAIQGEVQRIFYVHLAIAWVAYLAFVVVLVGSVAYLWRQSRRWDRLARCSAEIGLLLTTLVLITGVLWGKPVWGVWWTWDARLTTTLILWFIYAGYLMLRSAVSDETRAARLAAVTGIVGFVDVPVSYLSVTWWRTLHPEPTVVRQGGPAMPAEMLVALLAMLVAFTLLYVWLMRLRLSVEVLRERLQDASLRGDG